MSTNSYARVFEIPDQVWHDVIYIEVGGMVNSENTCKAIPYKLLKTYFLPSKTKKAVFDLQGHLPLLLSYVLMNLFPSYNIFGFI